MAISLNSRGDDAPTGPRMNVVALLVFAVPALAGVGWTLQSQNPAWALAGAADKNEATARPTVATTPDAILRRMMFLSSLPAGSGRSLNMSLTAGRC